MNVYLNTILDNYNKIVYVQVNFAKDNFVIVIAFNCSRVWWYPTNLPPTSKNNQSLKIRK